MNLSFKNALMNLSFKDVLVLIVWASIPILSFSSIFLWGLHSHWICYPIAIVGIAFFLLCVIASVVAPEFPLLIIQCLCWANMFYIISTGKFFLLSAKTAYLSASISAILFVIIIPLLVASKSICLKKWIKWLFDKLIMVCFTSIPIFAFNDIFIWGLHSCWVSYPVSIIGLGILIFPVIWFSIVYRDAHCLVMQSLFWLNFLYCIYRGYFSVFPTKTAYIVVSISASLFVVILPLISYIYSLKKECAQMKKDYYSALDSLENYRKKDERLGRIREKLKSSLK